MPALHSVSAAEFLRIASDANRDVPIEQDPLWDRYETAHMGCSRESLYLAWGDRAIVSLRPYPLHRHTILWARSGPLWLTRPTAEQEAMLIDALSSFALAETKAIALRLHVNFEHGSALPTFHEVAYDTTVMVDLNRPEEQILAGMRKRGRRDVRKALRSDLVAEEIPSSILLESIDELYSVMEATADRDQFNPLPKERLRTLIQVLLPEERVRVFAAYRPHSDGGRRLVAWALTVITGTTAQYYFGASDNTDRTGAADLIQWEAMRRLRERGVVTYDLMGIGSELAPNLYSLNTFKTKFSPDETVVAAAADFPLRPAYRRLLGQRRLIRSARGLAEKLRHSGTEAASVELAGHRHTSAGS